MDKIKVGVLIGSLRKKAFSKSVADCLIKLAPDNLEMNVIEIGQLPIYNQDYDEGTPPEVYTEFRKTIKALDAVLFVTPEHNRSVPAALKNALDIGSRPPSQNVWTGKPGAVVSQSPGVIGGFGANHHLRQVATFLNINLMSQPECYLTNITQSLDENGVLTSESTVNFLKKFMDTYVVWINRFVGK